jgi:hypothetical protein
MKSRSAVNNVIRDTLKFGAHYAIELTSLLKNRAAI